MEMDYWGFRRPASETSTIREIKFLTDYRGFTDSADGNGHRILILRVKVHE